MNRPRTLSSLTSIAAMLGLVFLALPWTAAPAHATFPGTNGKIAFATNRNGNSEIFTMNADGTNQTNLTNSTTAGDDAPQWSPDATKIAFHSNRTGNFQIYTMNADGSNVTRLTNSAANDVEPDWSPDGSKIAFMSDRAHPGDCNYVGNCEIFTMNADGTNVTQLTFTPDLVLDFEPKWSPDGSKIAFIRGTAFSPHDIWVMNADGSNQVQLTNFGSYYNGLATALDWSPDGAKIVFAKSGGGALSDIWVMNADGSNQANLTNSPSFDDDFPAWSPDGSKLVFQSTIESGTRQLYTMNADGTNITRLTFSSNADYAPDWGRSADTTPPAITITSPTVTTYTLHQSVLASYSCTDSGSGVASCAGPVASGTPIDTASVGTKTFTVQASDNAGNTSSQSVPYTVGYGVCLLYDPTKAHQSGSTIPIKIELCDANSADVSSSSIVVTAVSVTKVSNNAPGTLDSSGNANPDNNFRFDATLGTAGGYLYNLSTKGFTTGTYVLSFAAGSDPIIHTVQFEVK